MTELNIYQPVVEACEEILKQTACDFVGIALQSDSGPEVRWHYAAGNRNDKYKRITLRYGKGIAGRVIATGSPMMIEDFPNDIQGKALEYPILLAESLVTSFGVPLIINGKPKGVLLIGRRTKQPFTNLEQQQTFEHARDLEEIFNRLMNL
ncbi:GAF domain-containing protein [Bacillus sp. V3-13]|uniref:GAF domain-containing protein n=1 Tax=Bacillus sp. V3-13 TaxID=2053728 RepID=UPI000C76A3B0|nr:GAF domain-containing protein [Bacillus sp. V3-13]PLR76860.1 GAF domain-containing protein [Bacillus sp. V3-13]